MSQLPITIEQDEDGMLIAEVIWLPACYTQAPTMSLLLERLAEVTQGSMQLAQDLKQSKFKNIRFNLQVEYA